MINEQIKRYGIGGNIRLFFSLVRTKVFFTRARLIRFPIDIRGKRYISIGNNFTSGRYCRLEAYPCDIEKDKALVIGSNVQINDFVHITAMKKVVIGNDVLLASKIYISDCTHGSYKGDINDSSPEVSPISRPYSCSPVIIEDKVWIGESTSILPGVSIGKGAIVGANSVVTKDIPSNSIAVGIPAKVIKKYDFESEKWLRIQ